MHSLLNLRPLHSYNIFFAIERKKIVEQQKKDGVPLATRRCKESQAHVGFANLACIISERWKNIDTAYLRELEEKAQLDKIRHKNEMHEWLAARAKANESAKKSLPSTDDIDNLSWAETFFWEDHLPDDPDDCIEASFLEQIKNLDSACHNGAPLEEIEIQAPGIDNPQQPHLDFEPLPFQHAVTAASKAAGGISPTQNHVANLYAPAFQGAYGYEPHSTQANAMQGSIPFDDNQVHYIHPATPVFHGGGIPFGYNQCVSPPFQSAYGYQTYAFQGGIPFGYNQDVYDMATNVSPTNNVQPSYANEMHTNAIAQPSFQPMPFDMKSQKSMEEDQELSQLMQLMPKNLSRTNNAQSSYASEMHTSENGQPSFSSTRFDTKSQKSIDEDRELSQLMQLMQSVKGKRQTV
jgi:hypothetical protein